jgi:hypothetical protein
MSRWTKQELEEEVETLRTKLEDAYAVIGQALGFEEAADDEDGDDTESDDED